MTKKHFIRLAEVCAYIKTQEKNPLMDKTQLCNEAIASIMSVCQEFNYNFSQDKFIAYIEKITK